MASIELALIIAIALAAPSPGSIILGCAWDDDASGALHRPATLTSSLDGHLIDPGLGTDAQIIENIGQAVDANGALYLRGRGASVIFHADRITVIMESGEALSDRPMYDVVFDGSNPVAPEGVDPTGTRYSYFLGNDSARWVSGARGFAGVRYTGLWDGIDLVYRLVGATLKYDLNVAPHADPSSIRMRYSGAEGIHIDEGTGALAISLRSGICRDDGPLSFQQGPSGLAPVESRFVLRDPWTVGFEVDGYDPSRELVIDPRLIFSTYLGADGNDGAADCHLGPDGDVYVLVCTSSSSFPTTIDGFDVAHNGGYDIAVSRLSSNGSRLVYSTYIGGSQDDNNPYGMTPSIYAAFGGIWVDGSGAVFVTGHTRSSDFPTTVGAYDRSINGQYDGFVLKLAPAGDRLEFSTFLGGLANDYPIDICADSTGRPIVSGYTEGTFPTTPGAFDTTFNGGVDGFVTRLSGQGDSLNLSTMLGGSGEDYGYSITVDGSDRTYVVGYTQGAGFPTATGAYDASFNGNYDIFALKLDADWQSLEYGTFIGSSGGDYADDVVVDAQGRAYICGVADGNGYPTVTGCYDTSWNGDLDGIVLRLDETGSSLQKSTFYGSSAVDRVYSVRLAANDDVVLAGWTTGSPPTTPDAYSSTNNGAEDAFIVRFDSNLTTLEYGSLFGSTTTDTGWTIAIDEKEDDIVLVGTTLGDDFPTTSGAYDTTYNGGSYADVFILKLGVVSPPSWRSLPTLAAVEDVPLAYNFSENVTDIDTLPARLSITSTSNYVIAAHGLDVTFLFPNGVTAASVPLTLYDEFESAQAIVNFTIEPVNDPPRCTVPTRHTLTEDVPYTIEFGAYVTDVDNARDELRLDISSPYASATGLNLILTYPEGLRTDVLFVNVSDGNLSTEIRLEITVMPVDDPPVVLAIPPFVAVEDRDSVLNVTPYLADVDTPLVDLTIMVLDMNCTVRGKELHFLFHLPVEGLEVVLEVADAHSRVTATLLVNATPVNDPPVVGAVPPQLVEEGEPSSIDLSPYIMDEDTPEFALVLSCQSPFFVEAEGLNLILFYDAWVPEHTIEFSVFDGIAQANGTLTVQVQAVNDPPVILGIGTLEPPIVVAIREGEERWFSIRVMDEDSMSFRYTISSSWHGITTFLNGSLRVLAVQADVGGHDINLTVDDMAGGMTTLQFSVVVSNVDDPPTAPIITSPLNHTTVEEGTNVTFRIDVYDPDMSLGQVLTVTWVSNVSGLLMTRTSDGNLSFTTDALPIGDHRIDVTVTDGTHVRTVWLELSVIEKYVPPPPPPEEPSFFTQPAGIAAVVLVIVLVVIGVLLGVSWTRRRLAEREVEEEERARAEAERQRQSESGVEITMGGDLAQLSRDLGDMVTKLEAQRAAEASVAATTAPSPPLEPVLTMPTVEDEADRERTREMREVMRALTQLPQGLPTSLAGWDMAELARTIVDGEKRTAADGTPLVLIKGRWYCADRSNVGTFAREWKEPAPAPGGPLTDVERARKMERLETALLEGKITEETYRELKAKYEKG